MLTSPFSANPLLISMTPLLFVLLNILSLYELFLIFSTAAYVKQKYFYILSYCISKTLKGVSNLNTLIFSLLFINISFTFCWYTWELFHHWLCWKGKVISLPWWMIISILSPTPHLKQWLVVQHSIHGKYIAFHLWFPSCMCASI